MDNREQQVETIPCPHCKTPMVEKKFWRRISIKTYSGLPGSASLVKESIEYQNLHICEQCRRRTWVEDFPEFLNDPDTLV